MSNDPQNFICTQCPNLRSILNQKAQRNLPQGLKDFLSGENAEIGELHLRNVDKRIGYLFKRISKKEVADHYRRDLSGIDSENKLSELFCEITLASALSRISSEKPVLRPKNNIGKSCDVKVKIAEVDVYGESKRLEDPGPCGKRSIAKSPPRQKPSNSHRPRSMDIHSKLKDASRQFPQDTINIIFLFHPSYGNSIAYIRQALFGGAFFQDENEIQLENDGLFADDEWRNISGCAYTRISEGGKLFIVKLWQNPRTINQIPEKVIYKLKRLQ